MDMGSVAQLAYFTFRQEMKKTQKSPGMQRMTRKLSTGGGKGRGRAGQTSSSE